MECEGGESGQNPDRKRGEGEGKESKKLIDFIHHKQLKIQKN